MTQHDSLKVRFLTLPKNFTYAELVKLLNGFGYKEEERGRSSGSAVMFYNKAMNDKIMFHKPHPGKEVKRYILKMVIEKLRNNKMI